MNRTIPVTIALAISLPAAALACINTVMRDMMTYPLDFAHLGLALAALVLLRYRGQAKRPMRQEWEEDSDVEYTGLTLTREIMIVSVGVIAAVGIGFFKARYPEFEMTRLASLATRNIGLVVGVLLLSRVQTFGTLWVWIRRLTLAFVVLSSAIHAEQAWSGQKSVNAWQQHELHDPELLPVPTPEYYEVEF